MGPPVSEINAKRYLGANAEIILSSNPKIFESRTTSTDLPALSGFVQPAYSGSSELRSLPCQFNKLKSSTLP